MNRTFSFRPWPGALLCLSLLSLLPACQAPEAEQSATRGKADSSVLPGTETDLAGHETKEAPPMAKAEKPVVATHKAKGGDTHDDKPGQHPHQSPSQTPGMSYRSIDGSGNNIKHSELGATETPLRRMFAAAYEDGVSAPAGADRPSAREISNKVADQETSILNPQGASDYLWQWGQFIDHDIDLTEGTDPSEAFNVTVPTGDEFFTGVDNIPLNRSRFKVVDGVRQQLNGITAFLDGSNVYGSDEVRANALRTLDGTGRLKMSADGYMPYNTDGLPNAPSPAIPSMFLAGDVRANEQLGLAAMHTLFVREHNRLADDFRAANPAKSGEEIYQMARAIVGAEIQAVTFQEFLPVLLGENAIPTYQGYSPWVDPTIANAFSTAAYRFGHSALSPTLLRLDANLDPIAAGNVDLKDAFFAPAKLIEEGGIEPLLRGLAHQKHQRIDIFVQDAIRNFLFGAPGAGGFDLASLNIQRGRDHGLPSYVEARQELGLSPVTDFADISSDPVVVARLQDAYANVGMIDLWVGGLAEDPISGSMLGELFHKIVKDQFRRLRDGDRFWYEASLTPYWAKWTKKQTLAEIIRRNTDIDAEIPDNVFLVP